MNDEDGGKYFSITRWGKPCNTKYDIDYENKVFTSKEDDLVLDFTGLSGWTFNTANYCTFRVGHNCIFITGCGCTFRTGSRCTFDTNGNCTFSLWDINTCKFKSYGGYGGGLSIILDRRYNKAYKLTKEFIQLQKVIDG